MIRRRVKDLLRRIEAEPVKVELFDPILRIGQKKLTHGCRVGPIEVKRFAPIALVSIREIGVRVFREIVSIRADVVVNHIKNHA